MNLDKNNIKKIMPAIVFLAGVALLAYFLMPFMKWLSNKDNFVILKDYILSQGVWGIGFFLLLQVSQILIAFIPGEPVEFVSGMIYGTFGGLVVCLIGIFIGSAIIWFAAKKFGKPFVNMFISDEKIAEMSISKNSEKLDIFIFLLFLIPGTPKDTLLYICPMLPIKPSHFFLISTFARIPSIVSSTWAGATMSQGNIAGSVIILVAISIIGIVGIVSQKKIVEFTSRKLKRK